MKGVKVDETMGDGAPASRSRLASALRVVLALASVALFFTRLDNYAFALKVGPPPTLWVQGLVALAALLLLLEPTRPVTLLRSPVVLWTVFYFALTCLWGVWATPGPVVVQVLIDRLRSMGALIAFAVVLDDARARRVAVTAIAVAIVGASLLNIAETLSLVSFADAPGMERVPGRSSGVYLNPNTAGLAIALGLAAVLESVPRVWRVPLVVVSTLGAASTFSRGAMIMLGCVLLVMAARRGMGSLGAFLLTVVGLLGLLVLAAQFMETHDLLTGDTLARSQFSSDDSGRLEVALKAWRLFASAPVFGNGVGSTSIWDEPVMPHNVYLTLAADYGILGFIAFPALILALVAASRRAAAFALALFVAGFFGPTLLQDHHVLVLLALMSAMAAADPGGGERASHAGGVVGPPHLAV